MSIKLSTLKRFVTEFDKAAQAYAHKGSQLPEDAMLIEMEYKQKRKILDLALEKLAKSNDSRSEG